MHDERVIAAAVASLPLVGPARLRTLVGGLGASEAWRTLRGEVAPRNHIAALLSKDDLGRIWRRAATSELLHHTAEALAQNDITVLLTSDAEYPAALRGDVAAPAVLFVRGNLQAFAHRRVGIIGTRAASAAGRHFARRLARELSGHGVSIVSGLARGIDAAAHHGAIDATAAPPIAVVATGLDVVYPREHRGLWSTVARDGVIISESPPGCGPDAFRFPLRNRILAAISEVLVVVESRATGGSMITVEEALQRGTTVMAVPGSPHSDVSVGTNHLISQGATTVCDTTDVLVALGLDHRHHTASVDLRPSPAASEQLVLDVLITRPLTFDQLVAVMQLPIGEVALRLGRLEAHGWVAANAGWWEALVAP